MRVVGRRILGFYSVWILVCVYEVCSTNRTEALRKSFLNRCNYYQTDLHPQLFVHGAKDCDMLWSKFHSAFASSGLCGVPKSRFLPYLNSAAIQIPSGQSFFWSGGFKFKSFLQTISDDGRRYFTLEDTLSGYILDSGLSFCPDSVRKCPSYCSCSSGEDAQCSFWRASSEFFAGRQSGEVRVMINGNVKIRVDNVFMTVELPTLLQNNAVTEIQAVVVHKTNDPLNETCTEGGYVALIRQKILQSARRVDFRCTAYPSVIGDFMCHARMNRAQCELVSRLLVNYTHNDDDKVKVGLIALSVLLLVGILILILILALLLLRRGAFGCYPAKTESVETFASQEQRI